MIGYLKGVIKSKYDRELLIDVGGVGYEAQCSERCLHALPEAGQAGEVFIYAKLRDEELRLYGFISADEKRAFLELTKISGVGAKVALAILSTLAPEEIALAVASDDKKPFARVAGVGPKLAARLINELKNGKGFFSPDNFAAPPSGKAPVGRPAPALPSSALRDAVQALEGLGYDRSHAFSVASKICASTPNATAEAIISEGLRQLGAGR